MNATEKTDQRSAFEAIMRERSKSDLKINRFGNYQSTDIQIKWKYFSYGYQAGLSTQAQQVTPKSNLNTTYCLGYTHDKCESCLHGKSWNDLNQLPHSIRLPIQKNMERINSDKCRLTNMGEYQPVPDGGSDAN